MACQQIHILIIYPILRDYNILLTVIIRVASSQLIVIHASELKIKCSQFIPQALNIFCNRIRQMVYELGDI